MQEDHQGGGGMTTMGNNDLLRTVKQLGEDDNNRHAAKDYVSALGMLTIPLSRLPLENSFIGKIPARVVERWCQLNDPNLNTKQQQQGAGGERCRGW